MMLDELSVLAIDGCVEPTQNLVFIWGVGGGGGGGGRNKCLNVVTAICL